MKIIVLQGENEFAIDERLLKFISEAKRRKWSVVNISEKESILDKLFLVDLYAPKSLFIIENYRLLSQKDIKYIEKKAKEIDGVLVICSKGGKICPSFLKALPNLKKIEGFEYPKVIFELLDNLYPSSAKKVISILEKLAKKEPAEFVFHMIFSRIRDLYWAKVDPSTLPYSSWRVEKLERQASKFSQEQLKNFIEDLALIDIEAKRSSLGIFYYLDLLMIKHLK